MCQSSEGQENMNFTAEDLPAIQKVLSSPGNEDTSALIQCQLAANKAGLEYPVKNASELSDFLREINSAYGDNIYTVAWFEARFARFLPIQDKNDFTAKAELAIKIL